MEGSVVVSIDQPACWMVGCCCSCPTGFILAPFILGVAPEYGIAPEDHCLSLLLQYLYAFGRILA